MPSKQQSMEQPHARSAAQAAIRINELRLFNGWRNGKIALFFQLDATAAQRDDLVPCLTAHNYARGPQTMNLLDQPGSVAPSGTA